MAEQSLHTVLWFTMVLFQNLVPLYYTIFQIALLLSQIYQQVVGYMTGDFVFLNIQSVFDLVKG